MVASVARWAGVTLPTACLRLGTAKLENLGKEDLRPMNRKAWWMKRTLRTHLDQRTLHRNLLLPEGLETAGRQAKRCEASPGSGSYSDATNRR